MERIIADDTRRRKVRARVCKQVPTNGSFPSEPPINQPTPPERRVIVPWQLRGAHSSEKAEARD
jgi:hypothetical protein